MEDVGFDMSGMYECNARPLASSLDHVAQTVSYFVNVLRTSTSLYYITTIFACFSASFSSFISNFPLLFPPGVGLF